MSAVVPRLAALRHQTASSSSPLILFSPRGPQTPRHTNSPRPLAPTDDGSSGSESDEALEEPFLPSSRLPLLAPIPSPQLTARSRSNTPTRSPASSQVLQDTTHHSLFPPSMTQRTPVFTSYASIHTQLLQLSLPAELADYITNHYSSHDFRADFLSGAGILGKDQEPFLKPDKQGPRLFAMVVAFQCSLSFSSHTLAYACDLSGLEIDSTILENLKLLRASAVKKKVATLTGDQDFQMDLEEFFYRYPAFIIPVLYVVHACKLKLEHPLDWKTHRSVVSLRKEFQKIPHCNLLRFQLFNRLRFNSLYVAFQVLRPREKRDPPLSLMEEVDQRVAASYGCTKKTSLPFFCQIKMIEGGVQLTIAAPNRFFFQKQVVETTSFDSSEFLAWLLNPNQKKTVDSTFCRVHQTLSVMIGAMYKDKHSSLPPEVKIFYQKELLAIYRKLTEQNAAPAWIDPLLEKRSSYETFFSFVQLYQSICAHEGPIYDKSPFATLHAKGAELQSVSEDLIPLVRVLIGKAEQKLARNHEIFIYGLQEVVSLIESSSTLDVTPHLSLIKEREMEEPRFQDCLAFLERCECAFAANANWRFHVSCLAREPQETIQENVRLMEAYKKIIAHLNLSSKEDLALFSLVNLLLEHVFFKWLVSPSAPSFEMDPPIKESNRADVLNDHLRSIGLEFPRDLEDLLKNDPFFTPLLLTLQSGIKLRHQRIRLLRTNEEDPFLDTQQTVCEQGLACHCTTEERAFTFGNVMAQSLFPGNNQILTDNMLQTIKSPSLLKSISPYSVEGRFTNAPGHRPPVTKATSYIERALIFANYSPRFLEKTAVAYTGFRIECDTPYEKDGTRLFRSGKFIIGYAFPLLKRAAEIALPLDLTPLEMNLQATELFIRELSKFVSLSPKEAQSHIENGFSLYFFISTHPKKAQAAAIFSTFYKTSQKGLQKAFYTAPRNRNRFSEVQLMGEHYASLAKQYERCDALLMQYGFQNQLDALIPSYEIEGFCDSLLFLLSKQEGIQDKTAFFTQLHTFAKTTAERVFPKDKGLQTSFAATFVTAGKKAQGFADTPLSP